MMQSADALITGYIMTRKSQIVIALCLLIFGIGMGFLINMKIKIQASQVSNIESDIPIPKLVENQIRTNDFTCPNTDPLTYEACLLYQSALGIWANSGYMEYCKAGVDDNLVSYPIGVETRKKIDI